MENTPLPGSEQKRTVTALMWHGFLVLTKQEPINKTSTTIAVEFLITGL